MLAKIEILLVEAINFYPKFTKMLVFLFLGVEIEGMVGV